MARKWMIDFYNDRTLFLKNERKMDENYKRWAVQCVWYDFHNAELSQHTQNYNFSKNTKIA